MTRTMRRYQIDATSGLTPLPDFTGPTHRVEAVGDDRIDIWAEHDTGLETHPLMVVVVGTGHAWPEGFHYLGSTARTTSGLVWHVLGARYDVTPPGHPTTRDLATMKDAPPMKTIDILKAERDEAEALSDRYRTALGRIVAELSEDGWELKGAAGALRIAREALAGEGK